MLNKSVARRYAEALFAIAQDNNKVDELQGELELVVQAINAHEELKAYMLHPLIPPKDKKDVIVKLFGDKISEVTKNFLFLVSDKRREAYIEAMYEEYKAMANEFKNVLHADLVSAKKLEESDISMLRERLATATGKSIDFNVSIDPSLIGGIRVRVGDRIIDASIKKKLEMLKDNLRKVKIS
ncbi:MAG TPA: F0F1 ATP synthase subunit delta [Syntrophothermus lipocalidus]|uniref:ATP synthase subunit delta n=1 Tax=Syntrophothermus lipocalidus (strain DSM 12680 / TGB-C1) TaxID=643648 RepID=D7CJS1_SYNLT|nr:F0F1 ATP synthase subunit delta [Syntrophothermus lipocalidus]ADI03026.1 ATP synthase F1, delta subunit [Syntrophothermus lipocalidus DSM 12680]HHV76282.1 F0F1 ATP synthase subunit delta [Syntrophothermus lipocalidus]